MDLSKQNYLEAYLNKIRQETLEYWDDAVDDWHDWAHKYCDSLQHYLGFTDEEYNLFCVNPQKLVEQRITIEDVKQTINIFKKFHE